jgi:hypothetical protein
MSRKEVLVALKGGLNQAGSAMLVEAGEVIGGWNWEALRQGGYRRIRGYALFDGKDAPDSIPPGSGPIRGIARYNSKTLAFRNAEGGATCVMWESSGAGWVAKKTGLAPNGVYRFDVRNFKGSAGTAKLYGVSGTHKGFQWDGTTWTDITTGMTTDTPRWLVAFKNYLFYGFDGGSLQFSPIGNPTGTWSVVTGAGEIGMGDEITGLADFKGSALIIGCQNRIMALEGNTDASFTLKVVAPKTGIYPDTLREVGTSMLYTNEFGLGSVQAVNTYGDFDASSLTGQKVNLPEGVLPVCAYAVKENTQYRLIYPGGVAYAFTVRNDAIDAMPLIFPDALSCVATDANATGDMIFAGDDAGKVYRLESGTSFNSAAIQAVINLAFNFAGDYSYRKRFHELAIEMQAENSVQILVSADFDYASASSDIYSGCTSNGAGGTFDVSPFDGAIFDGSRYPVIRIPISGVAQNMALTVTHESAEDEPFSLHAVSIQFTPRGQTR